MLIKARVRTATKNETIESLGGDTLRIAVREKPQKNGANDRVKQLIARHFRIDPQRVRLKSGHHRPSKIFEIL